MHLNAYLNFDGNCEEAFKYYQRHLGGEIVAMMPFGETPACEHVPGDFRDKIMHARLVTGEAVLMGSDCTPDHPYEGVKGCSVAIQLNDPAEAERIFNALSENGSLYMSLQETFWAARFGACVDQFGVSWMVNCEQPGGTN